MTESTGAVLIANERARQIDVQGYDREHDARHNRSVVVTPPGDLVRAAICYADTRTRPRTKSVPPPDWPWETKSWKPKDRSRDLIRAGALIAAELDRLGVPAPAVTDRRRAELIIIETANAYHDDPHARSEDLIDALSAPLAQLRGEPDVEAMRQEIIKPR